MLLSIGEGDITGRNGTNTEGRPHVPVLHAARGTQKDSHVSAARILSWSPARDRQGVGRAPEEDGRDHNRCHVCNRKSG